MGQQTPLYSSHIEAGGKMVDFGGWDMPIHYGSQLEEHHAVRQNVGMFDVSHMTVVDVQGAEAKPFLRQLLANDVAKLSTQGKALYTGMLNEDGGVIDDLIVYFLDEQNYRLVVNCATREKDLAWINQQAAAFDVRITEQPDLAMIAVQGPKAIETLCHQLPESIAKPLAELSVFCGHDYSENTLGQGWFIGRTGYTGEDGVEIMLPADEASQLWQQLINAGVAPCGLGARDTLRLEAGMNLYGNDMDESINPYEAGMGWTVSLADSERNFIGRSAIEPFAKAPRQQFVAMILEDKGILRGGQTVVLNSGEKGIITSGGFSPTLDKSIALARVPATESLQSNSAKVDRRGKLLTVSLVTAPFVRKGKAVFKPLGE
ncbi:MAG: glycine cleavage system aminomethyltransferase GcvT [Pseudomonadota bacterium]|nr:glycine cleavage system aminomethyltransferase GcvT [Pseudomonadota bacterium]